MSEWTEIQIPAHGWHPRDYQRTAWDYLNQGGRHAELIWHRRAGKDDVCLHWAAKQMLKSPGSYWHMLPLANQVRKAIWDAVNSHTGRRRIHDAFPSELFDYRETDMFIRCKVNGSTWQCIGSDNYEGAIGSSTKGIVYSEWAQANPSARGYLRPMITENNGWQIFITTPRGKNHAYQTFKAAKANPNQFAQLLTIHDTKALTPAQLYDELMEYVGTYGEEMGLALYEQEYECSFEAAILGAIWGKEMQKAEREGRICNVPHDPNYPVHVATDLGRRDDFSAWWYQVIGGEIRVLEHWADTGQDPDSFATQLLGTVTHINIVNGNIEVEYGDDLKELSYRKAYNYGAIGLPHDGAAKTFAAKGKSVEEQLAAVFGWKKILVLPALSKQDQLQAGRKAIQRAFFDHKCEADMGIEGLKQYHREWDDDRKMLKDSPEHDWSSHRADAWMQLAVAWKDEKLPKDNEVIRWPTDRSFMELVEMNRKRRVAGGE